MIKLCRVKCLFKKHTEVKGKYVLLGHKVKIQKQGWCRRAYIQCECCKRYRFIGYMNKPTKEQ